MNVFRHSFHSVANTGKGSSHQKRWLEWQQDIVFTFMFEAVVTAAFLAAMVRGEKESTSLTETVTIPSKLTVKAGHIQPLWAGHPWVFKQAIHEIDAEAAAGDEVLVLDPHGKVLGRGLYSPRSAITVRLFTRSGEQAVDGTLFREKLEQAKKLRAAVGLPSEGNGQATTGYRLVHGEGDALPGLIVDVYGETLVVQLGTVGLKKRQSEVLGALDEVFSPKAVVDRTPKTVAHNEGFEVEDDARVLRGDPGEQLSFLERGLKYEIDLSLSQKTGYYFDQRPLREYVETISQGARVLDACCYIGSMAMTAARGGADEVWAIDKSRPAIEVGQRQAELNGLASNIKFEVLAANRAFKQAAEQGGYDLVICDPPKLASGRRMRNKAFNGYRKLAAEACAATAKGGVLAFCSCSGTVGMDALQRMLALGARDAGRHAVVFERCFQGPDHPVVAAFPEGLYLKVLLARIR